MKKTLSLLLVLAMVLSSFGFAFAAKDEVKPAEFLNEKGILKGNASGDLMLEDNLKRQDTIIMLSRLLGVEKEAKAYEGETSFTDIADPYYVPYIAWAEANKLTNGKATGKFGFDEPVTVQQVAQFMLRALGYGEVAWDDVPAKAVELKLVEKDDDLTKDAKRSVLAEITYKALGSKMKDSDKTLAEFLEIEMPEEKELTATVNDTENLKEVVVELSNAKLANKDKLESTSNYRIEDNTIERVEVKDNNVLVQVEDAFRSGKQYELQIKGVDKAIDGKYKFVAKDNTIPAVEKVEALGEYGIKVVTTEPIEDVRGRNFLVDGRYIVMNVETYGRNLILTPYSGSFPSNAETLTIEGLEDFAGYKSAKEDFDIEIVKDNEAPVVEDAILKGNKVEVVFDKDIYEDSLEEYDGRSSTGNISYELGRHTVYANEFKKIDTNKVQYEFKEEPSRRDDVTIVDVTNHSKVKMEKTTIALREVLDDIEPEIIKKEIDRNMAEGTAIITLTFDKEVKGSFEDKDETEFDVDDHFTLYEDEVYRRNISDGKVVSAKYDVDGDKLVKDVVIVELEGLKQTYESEGKEYDNEYILEIEGFTDASSSRNKMYREYYEFKFKEKTDFIVESAKVTVEGTKTRDTEIEIKFSKKLDRDIAEDATNYIFYEEEEDGKRVSGDDVADLDGEAILSNNGKTVTLEIPEVWDDLDADYDGLKILEAIKDRDGDRLDRVYYFDFASGKVLEDDQTVDQKAAAEVTKLINALPEEIKLENEKEVNDAKVAYDKLTADQKAEVKAEVLAKLTAAVNTIKDLKANSQTLDEAAAAVKAALEKFDAKNETTEAQLTEVVNNVITNKKAITAKVVKFVPEAATEEKAGKITVDVELTEAKADGTKVVKEVKDVNIVIPKIVPETFEVKLAGNAKHMIDYVVQYDGDLKAVKKGTTLTIAALKDITVDGGAKVAVGATTTVEVTKATTITVNIFVDKTTLTGAISTANAAKTDVVIDTDAANVELGTFWVTQEVNDALDTAIATAQAVADKADATQKEVDDAVTALNAAVSTYNTAKAEGTKVTP